ncbi:SURF1 family protein [Wolbachia endosymbiont of Howardula sp.]|uniref:SURF1 family protein n=1 Tax=Wolbachia endosymbiont of Howardula sp. TaxID=2916816 RepID=UPI00217EF535|nr:SURF1 family protein [Wolbachia endosymbiont of Howardula sp.]UWI83263.1 SURF1 family protein [Wolbachia endosymbiont of Howardula sp.]
MLKKILLILLLPTLLFFLLGLWQVSRYNWKNNIITNMNLPDIYLLDSCNLNELNYRRVILSGIISNIELYVFAGQKGYHILSPMLLSDGHYLLINKGIFQEKTDSIPQIKKIDINGVLYCDSDKSKIWFIKNDISANIWFTFNINEISNELGIILDKCILWHSNSEVETIIIKQMKHLEYAITWFLLALLWMIMCVIYYFKNP